MKTRCIILMLLVVDCLPGFFQYGFAADKAGLAGIQYGSEDFKNAQKLVVLNCLDKSWSEANEYGRQWSAKWEGFLVGPANERVVLTVETDQSCKIEIEGKSVTAAGLTMVEGRQYPITISYVKTGNEYDCYLEITWSWAGQPPTVIGRSSLVYADDVKATLGKIVADSDDDDDDDDDGDDEEVHILPPTWDDNTVPGSDELPLQYIGDPLPDSQAGDGRLRYAPGVQNIQINRANRTYPPPFPAGTENEKGWTYQHHVGMGEWKGKLYAVWDMTHLGEDNPPARLVYSTSHDGFNWSLPRDLYPFNQAYNLRFYFFHSRNDRMLVFAAGWYPSDNISESNKDRLYVREITAGHKLGPIYTLIRPGAGHPPFYTESKDSGFLQACREALANKPLLEQGDYGLLLGPGKMKWHEGKNWPGGKIGRFSSLWQWGKSLCFYTRNDSVIVATCKMGWVNLSRDGGKTWSLPTIPKGIQGGGGKLWAQATPDGRYAMIYIPQMDHRYPMAITASDDGITFDHMRVMHGDVSPQRYQGRAKDIGPQYLRGICEWGGDGSRHEKDCIWTIYSMNKEDIFVSRIPVPILAEAKAHANDNFDNTATGLRVPEWNTYSLLWAPVSIAAEDKNHYLRIVDKEPTDYARAIRTFPPTQRVQAGFRLAADQVDHGRLEIELLGETGTRPVRIILNNHGKIRAVDGRVKPVASFKRGLVGTFFRKPNLTNPESDNDVLRGMNNNWGRNKGGDWGARWKGFITTPYTGEVTFAAEAMDGLRLIIDGEVVINGMSSPGERTGKVTMLKGVKTPVTVEFACTQGKARLVVLWSWAGQSATVVPAAALSYPEEPKIEPVDMMTYRVGEWLDYHITADCHSKTYTLKINNEKILTDAQFAESSTVLYGLSLRTGEFRAKPSSQVDQDIPNSEEPVAQAVYRIDDVRTGPGATN